jgi:hypothetical protein
MPAIDLKQFTQPYVGSKAEMQDFLNPVRTTAQLADIADLINTKDKYAGRMVWDSTLGQPVWADGAAAGDTWSLATGVVAHTPS